MIIHNDARDYPPTDDDMECPNCGYIGDDFFPPADSSKFYECPACGEYCTEPDTSEPDWDDIRDMRNEN